jgi:glycosyltransferase involved in cell wall biosynthesis
MKELQFEQHAISIIIPTKNCADTIDKLMVSLQKQDCQDFEVIVVDSSRDQTGSIANSYGAKVIECRKRGLNVARNLGLKASSGKFVCFTDGDCLVEFNWLTSFLDEFLRNTEVGCVGGNVLSKGSSILGRYYSEAIIPIYPRYLEQTIIRPDSFSNHSPLGTRFPVGCNIAFRREVLLAIGGFDENWKFGGDEIETLYRMLQKGYSIAINPKIGVYHPPRSSIIETLRQTYWYGQGAGYHAKTHNVNPLNLNLRFILDKITNVISRYVFIFMKKGRKSILLYPFLDILIGSSYFVGIIYGYFLTSGSSISKKIHSIKLQRSKTKR